MGAWGIGPFENDDGSDFLYLAEADPPAKIVEVLDRVSSMPVGAPVGGIDAAYAVAAAALVAARRTGSSSGAVDESDEEWLNSHGFDATDEICTMARVALGRVRHSSELSDLWAETDESEAWEEQLNQLAAKLK